MTVFAAYSSESFSNLRKKWMIVISLILLMSTVTTDESVRKANDFMEELIERIKSDRSAVYSIDPLTVPNINQANFQTTDLVVKGLSKLRRKGNCLVTTPSKETTYVTCQMTAEDLIVEFTYWAKALFIWFPGDGLVRVNKLLIQIDTSFTSSNATLENLDIVELGDLKVEKVTGLSVILNWMLKLIAQSVFGGSKENIRNALRKTAIESLGVIVTNSKNIF